MIDMEDQKAIDVLTRLMNKDILDPEEKEAVSTAMGLLSWTKLAKSRIKTQQNKSNKSTEW
jgi:hypothetical protein